MWALCFVRFFLCELVEPYIMIHHPTCQREKWHFFVCYHEVDMYRINTYAHFTHCSKGHFFKKHSSPSPYSTIAPIKLCFSHCNEFLEFFSQLVETFFFAVQRIRNCKFHNNAFSLTYHLPLAIDNLILKFLYWFYTNHALIAAFASEKGHMKTMKYR